MYPDEDDDALISPNSGSDLVPRILSALVMIPAALAAVYFGDYIWLALVMVCAILLAFEWGAMVSDASNVRAHQIILIASVVSSLVITKFFGSLFGLAFVSTFAIVYMVLGAVSLSQSRFWAGFGVLYLGVATTSLYWLRLQVVPSGFILIVFLFVIVWGTDIGAYFVGRSVGGPKIFPSISPNKTWSGSLGGVIIAALLASLLKPALGLNGTYLGLGVAAIGLSCVAQAGDALESALKRVFSIKDSGSIIPGHGGVLDRLDALLLAAPVMAAFIRFSQ